MRYFLAVFILAIIAVVGIAGFRGDTSTRPPIEILPDMDRQPKLRPQKDSDFTEWEDGRSSRLPVEGTVARGSAYETNPVNTGRENESTNFVAVIPVAIDETLMQRGRRQYEIYCAPCHSKLGDGKGITTQFGMAAVADLHQARIVAMPDGEIFNTITHGKGLMGGYASNLDVPDRWAVVAYVRALQRSQLATIEDVPAHERESMNLK